MMVARYRHRRQALRRAVQLLAEWLPQADHDAVRTLVEYLWTTQDRGTVRQFGAQLRATVLTELPMRPSSVLTDYHGYRLEDEDDMCSLVLKEWEKRGEPADD